MKVYHFKTISSTNDYAIDLLRVDSPVVVTADSQWLARGRNYRQWYGDFVGNIYCSIAFRHDEPIRKDKKFIHYAIGTLAAKYALRFTCGKDIFFIKYPNDILALDSEGRFPKIGGVLVEHYDDNIINATVIGIGINILQTEFPADIAKNTTSLKLLGFEYSHKDVLENLIIQLEILLKMDFDKLFVIWEKELNLKGKIITLDGSDNLWNVKSLNRDGTITLSDSQNNEITISEENSVRYHVYP